MVSVWEHHCRSAVTAGSSRAFTSGSSNQSGSFNQSEDNHDSWERRARATDAFRSGEPPPGCRRSGRAAPDRRSGSGLPAFGVGGLMTAKDTVRRYGPNCRLRVFPGDPHGTARLSSRGLGSPRGGRRPRGPYPYPRSLPRPVKAAYDVVRICWSGSFRLVRHAVIWELLKGRGRRPPMVCTPAAAGGGWLMTAAPRLTVGADLPSGGGPLQRPSIRTALYGDPEVPFPGTFPAGLRRAARRSVRRRRAFRPRFGFRDRGASRGYRCSAVDVRRFPRRSRRPRRRGLAGGARPAGGGPATRCTGGKRPPATGHEDGSRGRVTMGHDDGSRFDWSRRS